MSSQVARLRSGPCLVLVMGVDSNPAYMLEYIKFTYKKD